MYNEYDVKADQIASDIGPVYAVTKEEAASLAHFYFATEKPDVQAGVAAALYRSYRAEQWGVSVNCPVRARAPLRCRNGTWVQPIHRAKPRTFVKRGCAPRFNRRPEE